jgi:hypothetical protein
VFISKTNLYKMLTNPFYIGQFEWGGGTYRGTHPSSSLGKCTRRHKPCYTIQQTEVSEARIRVQGASHVCTCPREGAL